MSYILDALRKSEKERALANIPTLKSVGHNEEKGVPLSWFVLAATVTVFVAALSGLWFGMKAPPSLVPAVQEQLMEEPISSTKVEAKDVNKTQDKNDPIIKPEQAVDLVNTKRDPISLSDLDPSVRSRLPDLTINALSYSPDHAKRFVMINQSIFKEGEDLGNGIIVGEIKKSSVILSFEGHQFILRPF